MAAGVPGLFFCGWAYVFSCEPAYRGPVYLEPFLVRFSPCFFFYPHGHCVRPFEEGIPSRAVVSRFFLASGDHKGPPEAVFPSPFLFSHYGPMTFPSGHRPLLCFLITFAPSGCVVGCFFFCVSAVPCEELPVSFFFRQLLPLPFFTLWRPYRFFFLSRQPKGKGKCPPLVLPCWPRSLEGSPSPTPTFLSALFPPSNGARIAPLPFPRFCLLRFFSLVLLHRSPAVFFLAFLFSFSFYPFLVKIN